MTLGASRLFFYVFDVGIPINKRDGLRRLFLSSELEQETAYPYIHVT